jgi:Na+/alanine symporter
MAALLVLATLTGRKVPFVSSDRAALIVLVVLGMAMCARGIGRVAAVGEWAHPLSILGYLVGALILVIAVASLAGKPLPLISSIQQAILAVALLSAAKLVLSALHRFLS